MVVADLAEQAISYTSSGSPIRLTATSGGNRIRYAALIDANGEPTEVLVSNGVVINPNRQIRLVTLNFLANSSPAGSDFGGDSYPFPWAIRNNDSANRVDLTTDGSANVYTSAVSLLSGAVNGAGTEQDALAEYMRSFYSTTAFAKADRSVDLDRRILQGNSDSDGDGLSNLFEVAALDLDPDVANTSTQVNAAMTSLLSASRTAGQTDVTGNPSSFSLYTAQSIQDLRGAGNMMVQVQNGNVTLSLPIEKSSSLQGNEWQDAGALDITFPKIADKEFYRLILPE
jgi:hypothetical protein